MTVEKSFVAGPFRYVKVEGVEGCDYIEYDMAQGMFDGSQRSIPMRLTQLVKPFDEILALMLLYKECEFERQQAISRARKAEKATKKEEVAGAKE